MGWGGGRLEDGIRFPWNCRCEVTGTLSPGRGALSPKGICRDLKLLTAWCLLSQLSVFQASWMQMFLLSLYRCGRDSSNRREQLAPDFKENKHQNWVPSPCHLDTKSHLLEPPRLRRVIAQDTARPLADASGKCWQGQREGGNVPAFPLGRGDFIAHESYSVKNRDSSKEPNTSLISSTSSISYGHNLYTSSLSLT